MIWRSMPFSRSRRHFSPTTPHAPVPSSSSGRNSSLMSTVPSIKTVGLTARPYAVPTASASWMRSSSSPSSLASKHSFRF